MAFCGFQWHPLKTILFVCLFLVAVSADVAESLAGPGATPITCQDVRHAAHQCKFVREHCQAEAVGFFNYLEWYYCAKGSNGSIFAMVFMCAFLVFLFLTLGIAASDFLVPNLSTIIKILKLSPSLAGATFLAFGNGSPDVFSTYAAMNIGSGSLAIGELIGAASFITAVVAGVMVLIHPVKFTDRKDFLLNVSFFAIAISIVIYFLSDGVLKAWECELMLGIYLLYVFCHWYFSIESNPDLPAIDEQDSLGHDPEAFPNVLSGKPKQATHEQLDSKKIQPPKLKLMTSQTEFETPVYLAQPTPHRPLDSSYLEPTSSRQPSTQTIPSFEITRVKTEPEESMEEPESNSHLSVLTATPHTFFSSPPRPGLSQKSQSFSDMPTVAGSAQNSSTESPPQTRRISYSGPDSGKWDESLIYREEDFNEFNNRVRQVRFHSTATESVTDSLGVDSPAKPRAPSPTLPFRPSLFGALETLRVLEGDKKHKSEGYHTRGSSLYASSPLMHASPSPLLGNADSFSISLSRDSSTKNDYGTTIVENDSPIPFSAPSRMQQHESPISPKQSLGETLPLLSSELPCTFWDTELGIGIATLFPSIFDCLALETESPWTRLTKWTIGILVAFPYLFLTLTIPVVNPETLVEGMVSLPVTKWLLVLQSIVGPFLVFLCCFTDSNDVTPVAYSAMGTTILFLALLHMVRLENGTGPVYFKYLSFVGFTVAIAWVACVANEVVSILKALGTILHISDAVLGLTVLALGNSLGDCVSNLFIAQSSEHVMTAVAACFGGPLLNILVGVGFSGLVVMHRKGDYSGYRFELTSTLSISSATLMFTVLLLSIAVPLNNWTFSKPLGIAMIVTWVVATTLNVYFEMTAS